jgi:hypothetical protein
MRPQTIFVIRLINLTKIWKDCATASCTSTVCLREFTDGENFAVEAESDQTKSLFIDVFKKQSYPCDACQGEKPLLMREICTQDVTQRQFTAACDTRVMQLIDNEYRTGLSYTASALLNDRLLNEKAIFKFYE